MKRKFNYFYKIENEINGKFYYGVHRTDNIKDDYMGSGKRIRYAIDKYGIENFNREILLFFDTYEEALDHEAEYVNEELLMDPSCYNLKPGGKGGFCNEMHRHLCQHNGGVQSMKKLRERINNDEEFRLYRQSKINTGLKKRTDRPFKGKHHTKESKIKIGISNSISQKGERNSQFGTCWITNGTINKKIHKGDLIPHGWKLGRKIK